MKLPGINIHKTRIAHDTGNDLNSNKAISSQKGS